MEEDEVVEVSEETRNAIAEAVKRDLQSILPYMLAKELRQDYPHIKFRNLVGIIEDIVKEPIADNSQPSCKQTSITPRILIRHQGRGQTLVRSDVDIELKAFVRPDAHPFQWTERDVVYNRLQQYLWSNTNYQGPADLFRYYTSGGRQGFFENTSRLQALFGELINFRNSQDLIVFVRAESGARRRAIDDAFEKTNRHPPDPAEWYTKMREARNEQRS